MKIVIAFAVILVVSSALASPAKDTKKSGASCAKACTADYNPLCGKPKEGSGTEITFGNNCVLENYNCEKSDKPYVKSADGECAGKAPVRLS